MSAANFPTFDQELFEKAIPEPNSGCWLWLLSCNPRGYGYVACPRDKKVKRAHRYIWELQNGPIPAGLCLLHTCDVPSCVNPDHLVLGTHLENMEDMVRKGRSTAGERNPNARFSNEIIASIFTRSDLSVEDLAETYSTTPSVVREIRKGKRWKHFTKHLRLGRRAGGRSPLQVRHG